MIGIIQEWNGTTGTLIGADQNNYFFRKEDLLEEVGIKVGAVVLFRPNQIEISRKGYLWKATLIEVAEELNK